MQDPSTPFPCGAGLEVFRFLAFAGPRLEFRRHPLVSFRSSTESVRDTTAAPVSGNDHFLEVSVLSALEASGVHSTRACLTRYVPPAGFRTLLTAFSSPHRPALFHAGGTLRISPFGAFPFQRSRNPLGPALPACRSPKRDYGCSSLWKSVALAVGVSPQRSPLLPWVSASPGMSPLR